MKKLIKNNNKIHYKHFKIKTGNIILKKVLKNILKNIIHFRLFLKAIT